MTKESTIAAIKTIGSPIAAVSCGRRGAKSRPYNRSSKIKHATVITTLNRVATNIKTIVLAFLFTITP